MVTEDTNRTRRPKRLYRSVDEKRLAGVCGGIAEYFDLDPTVVRLAWVIFTVLSGILPGIIGYIIAAMVMPVERVSEDDTPGDGAPARAGRAM